MIAAGGHREVPDPDLPAPVSVLHHTHQAVAVIGTANLVFI